MATINASSAQVLIVEDTATPVNNNVLLVPASKTYLVKSVVVTNTDASARTVKLTWSDDGGSTLFSLAEDLSIAVGASVQILKAPQTLETTDILRCHASTGAVVELSVNYLDIDV